MASGACSRRSRRCCRNPLQAYVISPLQEDDEEGAVYSARPFYTDGGALAPGSFDGDLDKGDPDSGSAMGTPLEGGLECMLLWMCIVPVCIVCCIRTCSSPHALGRARPAKAV